MITLDKCSGSCNLVNDLCTKICVPTKTNNANVKAFNILKRTNEAKTMINISCGLFHKSCDCKCKLNSTTCNSNQKWNNKTRNLSVKIIITTEKIIVGILANVFVKMANIRRMLLIIQQLCVMILYLLCVLFQQMG